ARLRRIEERKVLDVAERERLHAQDDPGERGAEQLRIAEARPRREVVLAVEAEADAVGDAAAASGPLVGGGLRDALDLQLLDLVAVAVAVDAREPGIDHVADPRDGERGLRDVGREHDAARRAGLEYALLLRRR